ASAFPRRRIIQRFALRPIERTFLNQHPLALVPPPRPAELDDDRIERGVLSGSPRERGISARQEDEMVEVGAGEAERLPLFHAEEGALPELGSALGTF